MSDITWYCKAFHDLTVQELYAILQQRSEVFVVEQNCVYQDADNKDAVSFHLTGWQNDKLVACCRLIPPGIAFTEASIGRVLTATSARKNGTGRALMQRAITETLHLFNVDQIMIGAQLYLKEFYNSLGFVQKSGTYLEDNIPHIHMLYVL